MSASDAVPPGFEKEQIAFRLARLSLEVFLEFRAALQNLTTFLRKIPAEDTEARREACAGAAQGDVELAEAIELEIRTLDFSDSLMYYLLELEATGVSMDEARCYTDRYARKLSEGPARVSLVGSPEPSDAAKACDTAVAIVKCCAKLGPEIKMSRDQSLDVLLNLLDVEVQRRMGSDPVMALGPSFGRQSAERSTDPSWCSAPTVSSRHRPSAAAGAVGLV
ncbi:hypothetical protein [Streptomyces sp. B3I7]|uniref:hypothetical protein n=1 Tax=Streptomyces sp. B3I7 TaxID=3042269 RepID=UPI0027D91790|nr:hypothetical protein [Streptomyces sp. B3I7]